MKPAGTPWVAPYGRKDGVDDGAKGDRKNASGGRSETLNERRSGLESPASRHVVLSRQAAVCAARGVAGDRARLAAFADAQIAEEAGISRRTRRLLALLVRNGRADGIDQAELMFLLLRGRRRLPAGDIAATMILAGQLHRRNRRRRVQGKAGAAGGRQWSRGLHPGLWPKNEPTVSETPAYRSATPSPTNANIGVIAVR